MYNFIALVCVIVHTIIFSYILAKARAIGPKKIKNSFAVRTDIPPRMLNIIIWEDLKGGYNASVSHNDKNGTINHTIFNSVNIIQLFEDIVKYIIGLIDKIFHGGGYGST